MLNLHTNVWIFNTKVLIRISSSKKTHKDKLSNRAAIVVIEKRNGFNVKVSLCRCTTELWEFSFFLTLARDKVERPGTGTRSLRKAMKGQHRVSWIVVAIKRADYRSINQSGAGATSRPRAYGRSDDPNVAACLIRAVNIDDRIRLSRYTQALYAHIRCRDITEKRAREKERERKEVREKGDVLPLAL